MSFGGSIALVVGIITLLIGAEMIVKSASKLGALLGIKPLVIGITVVAIGTSIPELAVGISASLHGSGSIAVGNIAGTNMVNILFILGLSVLYRPLTLHLQVLKLDLPMMAMAAILLTVLAADGSLTRLEGMILFFAAVPYTIALLNQRESLSVEKEFEDMCEDIDIIVSCDPEIRKTREMNAKIKNAVILIAGIGITTIGADWMVGGAIDIARTMDIPEAIIGLTIIAIGTSSPELATTIIATIRDEQDVAVGNLLGSSIYNILLVLGFTCIVSPDSLPVDRQLRLFDIPLMTGVALLCIPVFLKSKGVSRAQGGIGVAIYLIYMFWLILIRA